MYSRKVFLCGVLLFALKFSSTTAESSICHYTTPLRFSPSCYSLGLSNGGWMNDKKIESLDLSNFTFKHLTNIFLDDNKLTEMPRLPASVKPTLLWLVLAENKIASIPVDYFSDFQKLNYIDLHNNELTEMPRLPASVKAGLTRLRLSYNKIAFVPKDFFSGFQRLPYLTLNNNKITEMPAVPDSVKSNIIGFYVSNNNIPAIPAGFFSGFTKILDIWFHGNKIRRFPAGTSPAHFNLWELYIDQMDCDCTTLKVWQQILYRIEYQSIRDLRIYRNKPKSIRGLSPCSGDLNNMTYRQVRASTCTCSYINPPRFSPDCTKLNLRNSSIESLDLSTVNFTNLKEIDVQDNKLTEMPAMPDSVKSKIFSFQLANNRITTIPAGYFSGFSDISYLLLNGNEIRRFPAGTSLRHLSKLKWLFIFDMDCDDCATLRVWLEISAMTNMLNLAVYKNGDWMRYFPCAGNMTWEELTRTACSS